MIDWVGLLTFQHRIHLDSLIHFAVVMCRDVTLLGSPSEH